MPTFAPCCRAPTTACGRIETMNGAESLVATLVDQGVDICFANAGASEMHFLAALGSKPRMRSVLCLFEGVATGAALTCPDRRVFCLVGDGRAMYTIRTSARENLSDTTIIFANNSYVILKAEYANMGAATSGELRPVYDRHRPPPHRLARHGQEHGGARRRRRHRRGLPPGHGPFGPRAGSLPDRSQALNQDGVCQRLASLMWQALPCATPAGDGLTVRWRRPRSGRSCTAGAARPGRWQPAGRRRW
ncbi:MAG: hypothetical protein RJA36_2813 [Pseudomonadota bacterium]